MNDNEIIKAIEYCLEQDITSECDRCKDKIGCRDTLLHNALDLINRLKAEIERLDKLVIYNASCCTRLHKDLFKAKSEARKEFAERLCEGRVGNDPVVIAVKVELAEMEGRE